MVTLSPDNNALELAAVEQHLRYDEESSVEDTKSLASQTSPEKKALVLLRGRVDSFDEVHCKTPPQLHRTNRLVRHSDLYQSSSEEDGPGIPGMASLLPLSNHHNSSSPIRPQPPNEDVSVSGMSVVMNETQQGVVPRETIAPSDTFSLSTDSSGWNSDHELELRAEQIRADLRIQQLIEIAAVAERAAEAGHDSFTGLASTFGENDGRQQDASLSPLNMKRNNTYTEGQSMPRRPILRRNFTEVRLKRKIPVMALRHIDDLIPPMKQLHLHLRSHLYRVGVETEQSLVDEPIDLGLLNKKMEKEDLPTPSQRTEGTFIQRMTRWVANTSSLHADFIEEKKSTGLGDSTLSNGMAGHDGNDFEIGTHLCAQITSHEIASGLWKPSPLRYPDGLIPPEEQDFESEFATPSRMSSRPPPNAAFLHDKTDPKVVDAAPSLSSSENADSSPYPSPEVSHEQPRLQKNGSRIIPVALFDDCIDDEGNPEVHTLGSREYPKPFDVESRPDEAGWYNMVKSERSYSIDSTVVDNLPNVFVTPVRLKGIRDTGKRPSHGKSSLMTWSYSRAESFRSDPGHNTSFDYLLSETEDKIATSDINLPLVFDRDDLAAPTYLQPRGGNVTQIIDAITAGKTEATQAAGEKTRDPGDLLPPKFLSNEQFDDNEPSYGHGKKITGTSNDIADWQTDGAVTLDCNPTPVLQTRYGTPERKTGTGEGSQEVTQIELTYTPPVENCKSCEFLGLSMGSEIALQQQQQQHQQQAVPGSNTDKQLPPEPPSNLALGLRRVMSCPSLADTWNLDDLGANSQVAASEAVGTKPSILKVFERLSPKSTTVSDRTIYFSPKANHDYLNNYLYFGKHSGEAETTPDHPFEAKIPCVETMGGCNALCSAADTAMFLLSQNSPRRERDRFTVDAQSSKDYSDFHKSQETWFDAASEKFDGALERLVGSARRNNDRWRKLFEAPTLSIKTPHSARKAKITQGDEIDPKRVKGIILVPTNRIRVKSDNNADSMADEAFKTLYGISRNEFRALTREERLSLWQQGQALHAPGDFSPSSLTASPISLKSKRKKKHRSTMSSSDILLTP